MTTDNTTPNTAEIMPTISGVEILEPSSFNLESLGVTNFLNDILARLHKSDMVVKNVNAQNIWLRSEIEKIRQNK